MTRAGNWKVGLLIACFATVGAVHAADSTTDTQAQAAKDKSKDKVTKTSMSADKGAKAANGKTETASKASTATALDPGLEVPAARNRPATAATPTTGTRGFPKKTSESTDKSTTDASNANGAKKPATGN